DLHQVMAGQALDRLPHRRAAEARPLGDGRLRDPGAGCQLGREDQLLDRPIRLVGQAFLGLSHRHLLRIRLRGTLCHWPARWRNMYPSRIFKVYYASRHRSTRMILDFRVQVPKPDRIGTRADYMMRYTDVFDLEAVSYT